MHTIRLMKRKIVMFLVNHLLAGTRPCFLEYKRKLLNSIGHLIWSKTKIASKLNATQDL